ncbi:MAG: ATP-binding cassette domain-containing protein [Bacteroidales bacterium]|jgi:cell division transport system ATP-binding protein|nr:ATP-binding cassette domain-containing protein [Bacteroidales bacterium]
MTNLNIQTENNTLENNIVEHNNQQETNEEKTISPIIRLKNVDIFQQKILVLSDVSFSINRGEFVYVVGRTGSGKSNLLKLLYGDIEATSGEIEVVGYNMYKIKSKNIQRLRRKLGIVFQDYQLLQDRSVYENLKFVAKVTGWKNKKLCDERITEVLEMIDLKTKGHKMPHQLSGGEQQRVCIARALINNPDIILADEPTGNLDPESSYDIFYLFKQIAEKGTAVLVATHDFLIINQIPSRVLQIKDGKVFE